MKPGLDWRQSRVSAENEQFAADLHAALSRAPKAISPKYFYDEVGSKLFEQICELPEYYPTRTELALLQTHAADMAAQFGHQEHPAHHALLRAGVTIVEGLYLVDVPAGDYTFFCGPLRIVGAEGAPARAFLTPTMMSKVP